MESVINHVKEWMRSQPTSKRRTNFDDIKAGLWNRVHNSDSIFYFIRDEVSKKLNPPCVDYDVIDCVSAKISDMRECGWTLKELQRRGPVTPQLAELAGLYNELEALYADYKRWENDVDAESKKVWNDIKEPLYEIVDQISKERLVNINTH